MPNSLTTKQKLFAAGVILSVSAVLAVIIYLVRTHNGTPNGKLAEAATSFLFSLLATLLVALVTLAFKPIQEWVVNYLALPDRKSCEIRILLFGQTGCGKTSLANFATTIKPLEVLESSESFTASRRTIRLEGSKEIPVVIGDYRGQEPSQATASIPESFAGPVGNRIVNVLIFMVDLVGREHDIAEPTQILDDDKLLEWLKDNPDEKLARRLNQHNSYLSAAVLEILFSVIYSARFQRVYFIVTKADLIQRAVQLGLIHGADAANFKDTTLHCFQDVIARINAACAENKLPDCSVDLISLRDDSARRFTFDMLRTARGGE